MYTFEGALEIEKWIYGSSRADHTLGAKAGKGPLGRGSAGTVAIK